MAVLHALILVGLLIATLVVCVSNAQRPTPKRIATGIGVALLSVMFGSLVELKLQGGFGPTPQVMVVGECLAALAIFAKATRVTGAAALIFAIMLVVLPAHHANLIESNAFCNRRTQTVGTMQAEWHSSFTDIYQRIPPPTSTFCGAGLLATYVAGGTVDARDESRVCFGRSVPGSVRECVSLSRVPRVTEADGESCGSHFCSLTRSREENGCRLEVSIDYAGDGWVDDTTVREIAMRDLLETLRCRASETTCSNQRREELRVRPSSSR